MLRIPNAFLIAVLSLVPAALTVPASASVQPPEMQGGAATAPVKHEAASLSQDNIKAWRNYRQNRRCKLYLRQY
jgi:hypothetical protein